METKSSKAFSWQIENFSDENNVIKSDPFSSGGCEWCLFVYPKGQFVDDHMSLFIFVTNPESLLHGWRRRASCRFVLLNQSGKELHRTAEELKLFSAEAPGWGYHRLMPLSKLQEDGFMENNKITIEVYLNVIEVIHKGKSTENEMVAVDGFHVPNTQVLSVTKIFAQHPNFAVDIKSNIREVKTAYMNLLLGINETLSKPPQSLSKTELRNVDREIIELTQAGFKLDWLKSKFDEVYLERKKTISDDQEQVKNGDIITSDQDLEVEVKNVEIISSSGFAAKFALFSEFIDRFVKRCFLS